LGGGGRGEGWGGAVRVDLVGGGWLYILLSFSIVVLGVVVAGAGGRWVVVDVLRVARGEGCWGGGVGGGCCVVGGGGWGVWREGCLVRRVSGVVEGRRVVGGCRAVGCGA